MTIFHVVKSYIFVQFIISLGKITVKVTSLMRFEIQAW